MLRRALFPCILAAATAVSTVHPAHAQSAPLTQVRIDRPGVILQATEGWANWHTYWTSRENICAAPCYAVVPREGTYRVIGEDMPPRVFTLPDRDQVRIQVSPGSVDRHQAGGLLTVGGGVTALAGLMVAAGHNDVAGAVVAGVGFALAVLGVTLLATSGTTVTFD